MSNHSSAPEARPSHSTRRAPRMVLRWALGFAILVIGSTTVLAATGRLGWLLSGSAHVLSQRVVTSARTDSANATSTATALRLKQALEQALNPQSAFWQEVGKNAKWLSVGAGSVSYTDSYLHQIYSGPPRGYYDPSSLNVHENLADQGVEMDWVMVAPFQVGITKMQGTNSSIVIADVWVEAASDHTPRLVRMQFGPVSGTFVEEFSLNLVDPSDFGRGDASEHDLTSLQAEQMLTDNLNGRILGMGFYLKPLPTNNTNNDPAAVERYTHHQAGVQLCQELFDGTAANATDPFFVPLNDANPDSLAIPAEMTQQQLDQLPTPIFFLPFSNQF